VLEVLIKKTWEVAREAELRGNGNILPMGLAPKPGKTPPWRIINDGRECNEHVSPWAFRYETLKTLGLVLNPGDYMFTTDLEDAYYSMCLTEESRNLFGASLRMDKPSLEKLKAAGVLPEFQSTEEGDVYIRPRGLPMGLAPKPGKTPPWRIINDGPGASAMSMSARGLLGMRRSRP
jgi:hypothetical protein